MITSSDSFLLPWSFEIILTLSLSNRNRSLRSIFLDLENVLSALSDVVCIIKYFNASFERFGY